MVELKGSLKGVGLPPIVQLLADLGETGQLRVSNTRWSGELGFEDGHLIAAQFGATRGVAAVGALVDALPDADFAFDEGTPPLERNVSMSATELRAHLSSLNVPRSAGMTTLPPLNAIPRLTTSANGTVESVTVDRGALTTLLQVDGHRSVREIVGERPMVSVLRELATLAELGLVTVETPAQAAANSARARQRDPRMGAGTPRAAELVAGAVCPRLGFADDPDRHYSRPTALHRCYADGNAGLVTPQEQRDLCLGAEFPTCPRFVAGDPSMLGDSQIDAPPALPAPPRNGRSTAPPLPTFAGVPQSTPDAGPISAPAATPVRRMTPLERAAFSASARANAAQPAHHFNTRTAVIATCAGLLGVAALMVLAVALMPRPRDEASNAGAVAAAAQPTAQPTAISTRVPVAAPPAPAATASAPAVAAPAPTTRPITTRPTASQPRLAALDGGPLLEHRFAAGPPDGWIENPPYAGWSDGAYRLIARDRARFVAIAAPLDEPLADVQVSATFRKVGGPPGGGYGIIVRDSGPEPREGSNQTGRYYVVEVGDRGDVGVWRRELDRWVDLLPWTHSEAVRSGGSPNELFVRMIGEDLTFLVNGVQVAAVSDATLAEGGVGVFVGGDFNEVALDHFVVQPATN